MHSQVIAIFNQSTIADCSNKIRFLYQKLIIDINFQFQFKLVRTSWKLFVQWTVTMGHRNVHHQTKRRYRKKNALNVFPSRNNRRNVSHRSVMNSIPILCYSPSNLIATNSIYKKKNRNSVTT